MRKRLESEHVYFYKTKGKTIREIINKSLNFY